MDGLTRRRDVAEQFGVGAWQFTPEVVDAFDDHVRESVPFYDAIQDLVAVATDWLVPTGGTVADLGASTGTTVAAILRRHEERSIRAHLYDEQAEMLAKATTRLGGPIAEGRVKVHCRRIETGPLDHEQADLTTALFTLQFLPLPDRTAALRYAREASSPTGTIIIAEKIRPSEVRWAEIAIDVSHDWKEANGISAEAIRAKSKALRGVLRPHTMEELTTAILTSGWHYPEVLFRWHQWVVVGAFAS